MKETTAHGRIPQRIPMCFWRKSFYLYYNKEQNYTHEPPMPDSVC